MCFARPDQHRTQYIVCHRCPCADPPDPAKWKPGAQLDFKHRPLSRATCTTLSTCQVPRQCCFIEISSLIGIHLESVGLNGWDEFTELLLLFPAVVSHVVLHNDYPTTRLPSQCHHATRRMRPCRSYHCVCAMTQAQPFHTYESPSTVRRCNSIGVKNTQNSRPTERTFRICPENGKNQWPSNY